MLMYHKKHVRSLLLHTIILLLENFEKCFGKFINILTIMVRNRRFVKHQFKSKDLHLPYVAKLGSLLCLLLLMTAP